MKGEVFRDCRIEGWSCLLYGHIKDLTSMTTLIHRSMRDLEVTQEAAEVSAPTGYKAWQGVGTTRLAAQSYDTSVGMKVLQLCT